MGVLTILVFGVLALVPARPLPQVPLGHPTPLAERFDDYAMAQAKRSLDFGVRPGNEERFVRRSDGATPIALLYIHGFGASRAEGEDIVDPLSAEFGANVYYLRLPGHGIDKEAHVKAQPEEYFALVEEAFHRARPLGQKFVLVGSSAGGLLSIWLASRHPDDVAGVIMANPFFAFADPTAFLISRRAGMSIIETVYGPERDAGWKTDPEHRKQDGYEDHWVTKQYFRALHTIDDLRRVIATPDVVRNVKAPLLMFYYYADEKHQDTAASVPAMLDFFAMANGGSAHPLSRKVAIADGNHILFSSYVRTDKAKVSAEARLFLRGILSAQR